MINRLKVYSLCLLLSFFILIARLFYWQIYKGKGLSAQARVQYQSGYALLAPRGNILAADSTWLSASGKSWLVYGVPPDLKKGSKKTAETLAPFFVEDEDKTSLLSEIDRINELLSKGGIQWTPLRTKVSDETKQNIEKLNLKGIGFEFQETRIYPEASSGAHLLGFVGKNNEGQDEGYFGLEGFYDKTLTGKPGFITRDSDASGAPIILGAFREMSAIGGVNLLTHIDKTVQLTLDKKLKHGIEKYGALAGSAIVMNPKNGGILGMSSFPSYDPQKYWEYGDQFFNNPTIFSSFEPGSIFKVLIMAAGLDSGVINPDTKCDSCFGPLKIDKYFIETWNNEYYPESTMTDVIVHSDNVGMAYVGQKLGQEKMFDYLNSFGIGQNTGIDLQGEISPKLREKGSWGNIDVATASFGQGVATTPIQMLRAVAAIANKGRIMTPQVVDKIMGEGWEEDIKEKDGGRVISEKAANEMTQMMVEAAKKGEAKWTNIGGFKVAGKTGTAQIPIAGHYDEEKTNASFIGFAPYDNPKFIMIVTLQEPSSSPWASETAAPLWYSIAVDLFNYFGIQPDN
ncbi:hypothetical protein A2955_04715 [Candidatus Woesebacteria bacterium RIFCSPLOWO2_01_FULL_37_19]|uniref:Penicillin-binding protein transpeptidase domain-containing protein n=1 Tax=Candidatus Woesebacteria bacterium RIFCSPLOWO2_01_FULL_37_19 TaxID=1802514 RepID=A0A1F8B6Y7_9BACT|nr:MAG: hypothetical protein A2955_04715 [Candidatus Woesebacteria bacterium RIFCSPLOWO2_01_FULL_37_19]